ncbi:MAG: phosphoribosyltransferase family protein [Chloroflexota bacterium]
MSPRDTFDVKVAGLARRLPIFEVRPGFRIPILNILGDTEIVQACAKAIAEKLQIVDYDILVTAETKSIPLAHALSVETGKPYVILRKAYKPYMGAALIAESMSTTTGKSQTLILDEKDHDLVHGKSIVVLDDVISTGSTLQGIEMIMERAGATIVAEAAIFTEGDQSQWEHIIALGHLPVFQD